jgi:hypothetical protein
MRKCVMNRRSLFRAIGVAGAVAVIPELPAEARTSDPVRSKPVSTARDEPWTGDFTPIKCPHTLMELETLTITISPAVMNDQTIKGQEAMDLLRLAGVPPQGIRCGNGQVFVIPPGEKRVFVMTRAGLLPEWLAYQ